MDGGHSLERCYEVTEFVLKTVFDELYEARVFLEGIVLKPNMIVPGKKAARQATAEEIAGLTVRLFKRTVPVAVPGIAFLSGGQDDVEATANLDAINRMGPLPWSVTFSYGRALQAAPQKAWSGKADNVVAAQKAFSHRARMNGLAAQGAWTKALETA
jgi:fructose-bisphosphate aldolase class I